MEDLENNPGGKTMTPQEIKVTLPLFHLKNQYKVPLGRTWVITQYHILTYRVHRSNSNQLNQTFLSNNFLFDVCDDNLSHIEEKQGMCDYQPSHVMTTYHTYFGGGF